MFKLLWVLVPTLLMGQAAKPKLSAGKTIYVSNCSFCHGSEGEGGRGPNLSSAAPIHGATSSDLRRVISKGIPGTPMPSFSFDATEMTALLDHLRSLRVRTAAPEKASGDQVAGRQLYVKLRCNSCHRIDRDGSVYGPDLTRIGAGRSLRYLRESIVDPSADIPPNYRGVVVTTLDGAKVSGVRINEDTFSVQLRNIAQQFVMFEKSGVREVAESKVSLMPAYDAFSPKELDDLLAYLSSLKAGSRGVGVNQAEGINR